MQKAFVFDLNRCTGCHACQIACKVENVLDKSWRQVVTFNESRVPGIPRFSLSLACNHCIDAPCKEKCPALAITKDPKTGAVTINEKLCMGCMYCQWVCPYDAPKFNAFEGVVEKCTFCSHRLKEDLEPACATSCPTGALRFDDYSREDGHVEVPGFWRTKIEPAIELLPLRRGMRSPVTHQAGTPETIAPPGNSKSKHPSRVSLMSEWPLLLFTLSASILVALFHSWILAGLKVPTLPFATAGAAALIMSTAHLGKRFRFYRATLNLKSSWVSREVLFFSAFFAGSLYCFAVAPDDIAVARAVAAAGFIALFAMDKVYQLPTNLTRTGLHSASVLLTGLYLVGIFTMHPWFVPPLALVKLLLYLLRKLLRLGGKTARWRVLFAVRIIAGYAVPGVLWVLTGHVHYELIVASILVGEIVDRTEFYMELDFTRPETQAKSDLDKVIASKPLTLT
jgi:Fe-S-cluster-containing dehydrogenase component/DMSO reductase anchor subunit